MLSQTFFSITVLLSFICYLPGTYAQNWYEIESEHFKVLYRKPHAHLVPWIINSSENALEPLMKIFSYTPSEKIIIAVDDAADYGSGAATSVPQNTIRLEIEPFESGYETAPYNERIQWVISHELVHIAVNDHQTDVESFFRSIFAKVAPEQPHPITVFYSLLTNFSRYTPRWHQEAIAVFIETWFSGGYGRMLGNFDEMFFRSMILENKEFATPLSLDTKTTHNSFLLEHNFYLYGTRFCTYLIINYGVDKFIEWFTPGKDEVYESYVSKFSRIYDKNFYDEWDNFIISEKEFQQENISRLKKAPLTPVRYLSTSQGWVGHPYYLEEDSLMVFGYHKPHNLAAVQMLDLTNGKSKEITSLPSPSLIQIASTALDESTGLFFYTTNNNQYYRDLWVFSMATLEKKMLFEDCRMGDLSISAATHEIWGVRSNTGNSELVYSPYPYHDIIPLVNFGTGEELSQLSLNPAGDYFSAVLHRSNGEQSIIVVNADSLKKGFKFSYQSVTSSGSPESPSWSPDGRYIYWNAYVNGVSNIYRAGPSGAQEALSHTLKGFFKPVYLSEDSLFCFEFNTEGFVPVVIPNKPAEYLPAISYRGQKVADQNSYLTNWVLKPVRKDSIEIPVKALEDYSGLSNLKVQTLVPIVTGFQDQVVLGMLARIYDPIFTHDLTLEAGFSPFNSNSAQPKVHFKGKYEYKKKYEIGIDYNAPDFYDLFNQRKRGSIGTKFRFGNTHYWVFDNPVKVKQTSEIALYTDVQYINDNLVRVSQPDFFVAQTNYNYTSYRKSIGSSDSEFGQEINGSLMLFGANPDDPQYAPKINGDFTSIDTWLLPHNVFRVKFGAGYIKENKKLFQSLFFFGGFGNRALENVDVKQYRGIFRFPGIPIYSLAASKFIKVMVENNFPPVRFGTLSIGQQYINHLDFSVYSQFLLTDSFEAKEWINLGAQVNLILKHWFNLESTLSAGFAQAWSGMGVFNEWFVSFKLLRN